MKTHIIYKCTDCKEETRKTFESDTPPGVVTQMRNGKSELSVGAHTAPTYIPCDCGGIRTFRETQHEFPEIEEGGDNNGNDTSV